MSQPLDTIRAPLKSKDPLTRARDRMTTAQVDLQLGQQTQYTPNNWKGLNGGTF